MTNLQALKNPNCKPDYALTIYLPTLNTSNREAWVSSQKLHPTVIFYKYMDLVDLRISFTPQELTCSQPQDLMVILS